MNEEPIQVLDLRGLKCPLPVLKATKAMRTMAGQERIIFETTDPLAVIDIPTFCAENGHTLLQTDEHEGYHSFLVQKGD